jgi:hypothetical protein
METRAESSLSRASSFAAFRSIFSPVLTSSVWRSICCSTRDLWPLSTAVTDGRCHAAPRVRSTQRHLSARTRAGAGAKRTSDTAMSVSSSPRSRVSSSMGAMLFCRGAWTAGWRPAKTRMTTKRKRVEPAPRRGEQRPGALVKLPAHHRPITCLCPVARTHLRGRPQLSIAVPPLLQAVVVNVTVINRRKSRSRDELTCCGLVVVVAGDEAIPFAAARPRGRGRRILHGAAARIPGASAARPQGRSAARDNTL